MKRFLVLVLMSSLPSASVAQSDGGLDALDEDRVLSELAGRGLETLLERAFEAGDVPEEKRAGVRALAALRELSQAEGLSAAEREELVSRAVRGVDEAVAVVDDAHLLMQQAMLLARFGVEPEVNTLEYWGDDAQTREKLRPMVEAVQKLLEKAAAQAESAAERVAEQIAGPEDPRVERWIELDRLATVAEYTRHMMDYDLAISLEPGEAAREEVAERAIEYLRQFDTAESGVRPVVRLRIGKLEIARGRVEEAEGVFDSIIEGESGDGEEWGDASVQFEARYFHAVCALIIDDSEEASRRLEELGEWTERALGSDESAHASARAAAAMLRHRILLLDAEEAADDEGRRAAEAAARAVLVELVREQPAFRGRVLGQLGGSLDEVVDVSRLDGLELAALVRRADVERMKGEREAVDREVLELGVLAAREILRRAEGPGERGDADGGDPDRRPALPGSGPAWLGSGPDLEEVEDAAIRLPLFLLRLGREVEAAEELVAYLDWFGAEGRYSEAALERALGVVGELRAAKAQAGGEVDGFYDRVLKIATGEGFERSELAYEYARRLHARGELGAAVEAYRKVPADDPRLMHARFYEMTALQRRLEREARALDAESHQAMRSDVQRLAGEVTRLAERRMAEAGDEAEREAYRGVVVRAMLMSADGLRLGGDAAGALERLEGIEESMKGLRSERELMAEAQLIRVHSYMALGQNTEAAEALVRLLESQEGGEGAEIVFGLLSRLDDELDEARSLGNEGRMRELARGRAMLSGFLVDWAREHPEEEIRRYTYRYMVFDAATQHLAAQLETDVERREAMLTEALGRYEALRSEENVRLYREMLRSDEDVAGGDLRDPLGRGSGEDRSDGADAASQDPAVMLGIALVQFDLGNYDEAQPLLGRLLSERRLGGPRIAVEEGGGLRFEENERYWEAQYKLMRSNVELARSQQAGVEALEATRRHLAMLYIREGDEVGGRKWREAFEGLREELEGGS